MWTAPMNNDEIFLNIRESKRPLPYKKSKSSRKQNNSGILLGTNVTKKVSQDELAGTLMRKRGIRGCLPNNGLQVHDILT